MNANLRHVRSAVEENGGRIVGIKTGGRHWKITVAMANGHTRVLTIRRSNQDVHKIRGWVRQAITNFTVNGKGAA